MFETVQVALDDALAIITLNRPDRLNAINDTMIDELTAAVSSMEENEAIRVVIITGAGEKAFCVGMDLKDRKDISAPALLEQRGRMVKMFGAIRRFPKPLIAAVNGYALGGGLEIGLNSDFMLAADHAFFGLPEVKRGIMPGGGGTQLLPLRIGAGRARELIYTGDPIDAAEALRTGLVNQVVPIDGLMPLAREIAGRIAANGPIGVKQAKRAISFNQSIEEAIRFEAEAYQRVLYSEDRREGFLAFNEKRRPVYKGR